MATVTVTKGDIKMSSAQVTFKSVDLGGLVDGVTFSYTRTFQAVKVDQLSMIVKWVITEEACQASFTLSEYNLTKMQYLLGEGTYVLDAGAVKKKISVGGGSVADADYGELIITPTIDGSGTIASAAGTPNDKITIFSALCTNAGEIKFAKTAVRGIQATFEGSYYSSGAAGAQLFLLGDSTATA